MGTKRKFRDVYTRKISGENYEYEAEYVTGETVNWRANVYKAGELKGSPAGTVTNNTMKGDGLKQYIIAYIEGIIEKGLGIDE